MILANIKPAAIGLIILSTIAAPVFTSMLTSCNKDEPITMRDTSFYFGPHNFSDLYPNNDKVRAAADLTDIANIYIVSDGEDWAGVDLKNLANSMLRPAFEISPKIKGKGTIRGAVCLFNARLDSFWCVEKGYDIIPFGRQFSSNTN